jgi:hypothetical protein
MRSFRVSREQSSTSGKFYGIPYACPSIRLSSILLQTNVTLILTDICEIVYEQHVAGYLHNFENLNHLCSAMPVLFL